MTPLEKELAYNLARMVEQNCSEAANNDHCFSGFIRCHSDAMRLLVRLGLMTDDYPGKQDEFYRGFDATFVPDWEIKLRWRANVSETSRACDICGKISTSYADDYECKYCTEDHNACCRDEEHDCCKNCADRIRKGLKPAI